ncbi:hypothetical protein GGR95_003194 [Sulfitobacter undariae]|uniref:Uncharacterized protein n=1 Tax=Sulfitobacter undariae TaxID=1563671 RepID=A0A7W6H1T8_9RHOB|nr:hypothetical protein [Sulfitobacter undariae]
MQGFTLFCAALCIAEIRLRFNVRFGPEAALNTGGRTPTLAAIRTNGNYAQEVNFAKL